MKTVIGLNKMLYLKSELINHYQNNKIENNLNVDIINYYLSCLDKHSKNLFMFIVPDKSVVCKDNLPEEYDKNRLLRDVDYIKNNINYNFIDLYEKCELNLKDYHITDSHINHIGSLKIVKEIMKYFIPENDKINEIDNYLKTTIISKFYGDLTSKENLKNQQLVIDMKLYEDLYSIDNVLFNDYENIIKDIDVKYRFCYVRPSSYVYNKNANLQKTVLIYGDSTVHNKLFEFLSFYFRKTFFYWNHYHINNELLEKINPDIIFDIRTERFVNFNENIKKNVYNYDSNYNKNDVNQMNFNEIYSILVNFDNGNFSNIIKNIINLDEIKNNLEIFSHILCHDRDLIIPYINIERDAVLELNKDLLIFYNDKTNIDISDLKLIHFINMNKDRKYKYENIPEDFNAKTYIELNEDLKHMTEIQSKIHYEYDGYKENRNYK